MSNKLTSTRIDYLLNPNDRQDVKLAYDMLHDIWSLPLDSPPNALPGFIQARMLFKILGELFRDILMPYICVDLSLSEQLIHLSAAAHLLLALFSKDTTKMMPTQLYVDIMNYDDDQERIFLCCQNQGGRPSRQLLDYSAGHGSS